MSQTLTERDRQTDRELGYKKTWVRERERNSETRKTRDSQRERESGGAGGGGRQTESDRFKA